MNVFYLYLPCLCFKEVCNDLATQGIGVNLDGAIDLGSSSEQEESIEPTVQASFKESIVDLTSSQKEPYIVSSISGTTQVIIDNQLYFLYGINQYSRFFYDYNFDLSL